MRRRALLAGLALLAASAACTKAAHAQAARRAPTTLLNVSYDPTRELYAAINPAFRRLEEADWTGRPGPRQPWRVRRASPRRPRRA